QRRFLRLEHHRLGLLCRHDEVAVFFHFALGGFPPFFPIVADDIRHEHLLNLVRRCPSAETIQHQLDQIEMMRGQLADAFRQFCQRLDMAALDFSRRRQFFKFGSHNKIVFSPSRTHNTPLNAMNGQNPREIAARVLGQRKAGGEFTENLLDRALAGARLSSPDRGLCQEIVYGVVRWQAALDWLIARKTGGREQKAALQNLLRLGLYQIFWLDRIPDHAAVHETVELAKQNGFGPQAGFVNAILRGYLRETDETKKLLADLKVSNPAIGFSHPQWLLEKWQNKFGLERTTQLLAWNNTPPKTFARVNSLKFSGTGVSPVPLPSNVGDLLIRWREENVGYDFVRRDWLEENLVFELK